MSAAYSVICYGVKLIGNADQPWGTNKLQDWWRELQGYENPIENPYNEAGDRKPEFVNDWAAVKEYQNNKSNWDNENPVPFVLVKSGCSVNLAHIADVDFILALAGLGTDGDYNEPATIDTDLMELGGEEHQLILDLCESLEIKYEGEPQWWLCSFYG